MLEGLKNKLCEWLSGGPQSDVAVCSRAVLARNIAGYPFIPKAKPQEIARLEELLRGKIMAGPLRPELEYHRVDWLDPLRRELLVERRLMDRDHALATWVRAVAFCADESLSLIVNEEDHLRVQVTYGGLQLEQAWQDANRTDDALAEVIPFAFSASYGYLTASPTDCGTGLRASVTVHLPALVIARELDKVLEAAQRRRCAVRGYYADTTHAAADFYHLFNQATLGVAEEDLVAQVSQAAQEAIALERACRENLCHCHRSELKSKLDHALHLLASASAISSEEALNLLSQVRMGVEIQLTQSADRQTLNELMLLTLPAHLQTMEGRRTEGPKGNRLRAEYIRRRLGLN